MNKYVFVFYLFNFYRLTVYYTLFWAQRYSIYGGTIIIYTFHRFMILCNTICQFLPCILLSAEKIYERCNDSNDLVYLLVVTKKVLLSIIFKFRVAEFINQDNKGLFCNCFQHFLSLFFFFNFLKNKNYKLMRQGKKYSEK